MKSHVLVALAGQPNCGKSTVFNMLTGARQHVANYPGVTVEKKSGEYGLSAEEQERAGGRRVKLVDLPGTYSMTSYSLEERVARDFLLHSQPEALINIVDAANLKRNLYLTLQLLEMELPLMLVANMMDVAERRSIKIDLKGLSSFLKVPVVPSIGRRGEGTKAIKEAVVKMAEDDKKGIPQEVFHVDYQKLEPYLEQLVERLAENLDIKNPRGGRRAYLEQENGQTEGNTTGKVCQVNDNENSYHDCEDKKSSWGHGKAKGRGLGQKAPYIPLRWLSIKLMENDAAALEFISHHTKNPQDLLDKIESLREDFEKEAGLAAERHIAFTRHRVAGEIANKFVKTQGERKATLSDRADRIVCHRFFGPAILVAILIVLYQISIVFGSDVAAYVWPFWSNLQLFLTSLLPEPGFVQDPALLGLGVWVMTSIAAILNYLPIFFLLFSFIAILEDSGYMPRMAFILDRAFRRFGLHGQSTLPLILGGVYVGGCAIPAVMATKAIPDEKARLATILIAPMMNCLAKVPLYLILIGAYFNSSGMALFFIATITLFMALPVAKLLTLTVLHGKESAPFIMEMPPYHLPTLRGVLSRAIERIWLFIKKIITVVAAVAVVLFALISYPGLSQERVDDYLQRAELSVDKFIKATEGSTFEGKIKPEEVNDIILFDEALRNAKRGITSQERADAIDKDFQAKNPMFYDIARGASPDGRKMRRTLMATRIDRLNIRREYKEETFETSFMGKAGKAIEPVTKFAGFNWRINIALLSAFAAKENSAATLGAIYGIDGDAASVQESMKKGELDFGPLHALALMLFMALYPPCIPTAVMVKTQANSVGWMLFSVGYQTLLGFAVAVLVFTGGTALGLSGWQAMWSFYALCIVFTIVMGLVPDRKPKASPSKELAET